MFKYIFKQIHKAVRFSSNSTTKYQKEKLQLTFNTKVPQTCLKTKCDILAAHNKVDESTINLLEQLSLVECANENGIKTLEDAIDFAENILDINTNNVEPLYTILEDRYLMLRNDKVTDGFMKHEIIKNAALIEEDYFVAPPGNIPLTPKESRNLLSTSTI